MEEIPDAWPPVEEADSKRIVPLFALPEVWLFPYLILPLRIFEPRYRQMIQDCLDGPGRIVLGTVCEGSEDDMAGSPPVYPIAGLGEIGRHEEHENGEFSVMLVGLQRVLIREVESDRLYRKLEIEPAQEIPLTPEREVELRAKLIDALRERSTQPVNVPDQVPTSHLTDLLVLHTPLPHREMNRLFSDLDLERRIEAALAEHAQRPKSEERQLPMQFFGDVLGEEEPDANDEEGEDFGGTE